MNKTRNDKESMISLMPKPNPCFIVSHIWSKQKNTEKKPFKEKAEWRTEQNSIKKDPTNFNKKAH